MPTTEVLEDVLAERSEGYALGNVLPLPSVDLEGSVAVTPAISVSEAKEDPKTAVGNMSPVTGPYLTS